MVGVISSLAETRDKELLIRFDEASKSFSFWFENERFWGHFITTENPYLEVRDDFLVWRSAGELGSEVIRIDRVTGEISDDFMLPGMQPFRSFKGTCTSKPEETRPPLTPEQRKF